MADGDERGLFRVETPESVTFAYELAGLGSRGMALALDTLAITVLLLGEGALALILYVVLERISPALAGAAATWVIATLAVAWFATYWAYFVFGEVVRNGRTWGKARLGLRVVRDDGSRVGFFDSVIRNLLRVADILPGNYAVGMIAILVNPRAKRLGDMAAGTVVVRDSGAVDLVLDGAGGSQREALAREFLRRRTGLTPDARMQVALAVLGAFGEQPDPAWDEPTAAGRIADLCGARGGPGPEDTAIDV